MKARKCLCILLNFIVCLLPWYATLAASQATPSQTVQAQPAASQSTSGSLRGQVIDPSGAAIAGANVVLTPAAASSTPIKAQANGQGQYEFNALAPGQYT